MFSGAGGLDLGFELAGHQIVWANDFDTYAVQTYRHNLGKISNHPIIDGDIVEYLNNDRAILKQNIPNADVVIGGFPCQGFTIANINRSMNDQRNFLYLQILKMIELKDPNFILLENVKGLENIEGGKILPMIINDLEKIGKGYNIYYNVINAMNYGVPQNRERIIIYGVKKDLAPSIDLPINRDKSKTLKILNIPSTHSKTGTDMQSTPSYKIVNEMFEAKCKNIPFSIEKYFNPEKTYKIQTLKDTISDLPKKTNDPNFKIYNHTGSACKVIDKTNIKATRVGNRPTQWDKYAPTIMGRGSGTGGPLIIPHPEYNRRMSIREVARIQTFPDSFEFIGANSACYRQIGNAVPVLMAYNIAKIIP